MGVGIFSPTHTPLPPWRGESNWWVSQWPMAKDLIHCVYLINLPKNPNNRVQKVFNLWNLTLSCVDSVRIELNGRTPSLCGITPPHTHKRVHTHIHFGIRIRILWGANIGMNSRLQSIWNIHTHTHTPLSRLNFQTQSFLQQNIPRCCIYVDPVFTPLWAHSD